MKKLKDLNLLYTNGFIIEINQNKMFSILVPTIIKMYTIHNTLKLKTNFMYSWFNNLSLMIYTIV